jgi:hypothetical protein
MPEAGDTTVTFSYGTQSPICKMRARPSRWSLRTFSSGGPGSRGQVSTWCLEGHTAGKGARGQTGVRSSITEK